MRLRAGGCAPKLQTLRQLVGVVWLWRAHEFGLQEINSTSVISDQNLKDFDHRPYAVGPGAGADGPEPAAVWVFTNTAGLGAFTFPI